MIKKYSLFFILLVLLPFISLGQDQKEIDSLQTVLTVLPRDTAKIEVFNRLAQLIVDIEPDKSISYAKSALQLSKEKNYPLYQAVSLNNIGNGYYNLADFETCLDYYLKALTIQEKLANKRGILSSSGAIGNVFLSLNKPDEALPYFERALVIATELKTKNGTASCLISIGTAYSDKHDYEKALGYFFKSLPIFQEVDNEDATATNYNNIADTYHKLKDYPKTLFYIMKALELYEKTGNIYGQSLALNNIGDFYESTGNGEKALEYYKKGLQLGESIKANEHMLQSYKGISKAHKKMGNFKQALEIYELYQGMNDSIYNVESSKQIAEMQTRFDSEKKEQQIVLLTKDKKIQEDELSRKSLVSKIIIALAILIFILSIVMVWAYLQKKNANRELDIKNQKIELAYNIIEDQHKDIKDSINYAKRIQEAILPPSQIVRQLLPDSFVLYMPKDVISGDFYWVEPWGNKVLFAAVDCTGHGVPGALMSVVGYNLLGKALNELGLSRPALILNSLSKGIGKTLRQTGSDSEVKDGMDIALCAFDTKTYLLEYAGAFNPLYIVRDGILMDFASDKIPIGTSLDGEMKNYTNQEIQLQKGDTIYIFTDGYADQFGGDKGKKLKYKALQNLLISFEGTPMEEQKELLETTIIKWKGNLAQVDDILIMGVRV
ncbi:MAG TPA: tetratricopeptide repeat protein [Bacteroidia bacterium]